MMPKYWPCSQAGGGWQVAQRTVLVHTDNDSHTTGRTQCQLCVHRRLSHCRTFIGMPGHLQLARLACSSPDTFFTTTHHWLHTHLQEVKHLLDLVELQLGRHAVGGVGRNPAGAGTQ
jgi:hypothetical protein